MVVIKLVIQLLKFVHMDPRILVEPLFMSMRRVGHNQVQVWLLFLIMHHNIVVIVGFLIVHDNLMVVIEIFAVTRVGSSVRELEFVSFMLMTLHVVDWLINMHGWLRGILMDILIVMVHGFVHRLNNLHVVMSLFLLAMVLEFLVLLLIFLVL